MTQKRAWWRDGVTPWRIDVEPLKCRDNSVTSSFNQRLCHTFFSRLSRLRGHCANDMNNFPSGKFANLHKENNSKNKKQAYQL